MPEVKQTTSPPIDVDKLRFASSRCHNLTRITEEVPELVPVIITWDAPDGGQVETRHTIAEMFRHVGRMIDEAIDGQPDRPSRKDITEVLLSEFGDSLALALGIARAAEAIHALYERDGAA
jgi:hypothetical protein